MPDNKRNGPRSRLQKQKTHRGENAHHRAKNPAMDEIGCEQFVLTVEILVSDKRRRDLDGALATACDMLIALRRQLEGDTGNINPGKKGSKRR